MKIIRSKLKSKRRSINSVKTEELFDIPIEEGNKNALIMSPARNGKRLLSAIEPRKGDRHDLNEIFALLSVNMYFHRQMRKAYPIISEKIL